METNISISEMNLNDYQLLLDINISVAKTQTRQELVRLIFDQIRHVVPFDCPGLFTIDPSGEFHTELSDDNSVLDPINRYVYEHMDSNSYPHEGTAIDLWSRLSAPEVYDLKDLHENTATHPHFPHMLNAGLKQIIAGPLIHEGKRIGILCLSSTKPNAYKDTDILRFQGICNQLAIAVSNILSKERIQLKEWEKSTQLEIINAMHTQKCWEQRLMMVAKILRKSIPYDVVSFSMIGERFSKVNYGFELIGPEEFRAISIESFLKMTQLAADEFKEYFFKSIRPEPAIFNAKEYAAEMDKYLVKQKINQVFKVNSSMTFLLEVDGEKFFVAFYSKAENPYQKRHISLFECIQSAFILAMEKILLFEEVVYLNKLLKEEKTYLKEQVDQQYNFSEMIGQGLRMQQVFEKVKLVTDTDTNVLILGETGTGKELIARALHNLSERKDKPLIKVNCASLPRDLIESELFGHEKGAFTGALNQRIGKFELADGGTIFLDEIGELPIDLQPKLLRAIQEKEFERLGGQKTINIHCRIIAATNRDLEEEVAQGKFRADLFYRLSVFPIELPPLRTRGEDIEFLADYFVKKNCQKLGKERIHITKGTLKELETYQWPGNVRELEHVIERSVLLTDGKSLQLAMSRGPKKIKSDTIFEFKTLQEAETELLLETLKHCNGKVRGKGGAAEKLDLAPSTLEYRMKRAGITKQMVVNGI